MNYAKLSLWVVVAVLVALLAGFLWGRSGKSSAESRLRDAELQATLADARAQLLAARVDIFEVNFGRAGQHLQGARHSLQEAAQRLSDAGRTDEASRVKDVGARAAQAQEQAGRLDQSANTGLSQAIALLDQVGATKNVPR
jgi:hypothetical protein